MAEKNKKQALDTISKSFSQWTIGDIKETFELTMEYKGRGMEELVQNTCEITEMERKELNERHERLIEKAGVWNEMELEVFFLVPILDLLKMDKVGIESFVEKPFGATVDNYYLSGEMDWVIANGFEKPKAPFFFA